MARSPTRTSAPMKPLHTVPLSKLPSSSATLLRRPRTSFFSMSLLIHLVSRLLVVSWCPSSSVTPSFPQSNLKPSST
ncbi:hypothetical protein M405DRAFT_891563 [Rhizopogon salebrosus TDB-379]|nr:hypothetical protein M405DRAFT_891563 [Rhizopogon salebrosus TDB-379]